VGRDRQIALSTRSAVIQPVQLVDRKRLIRKPSLRPQLVNEHLTKRRKGCEPTLFDKIEPRVDIRNCPAQAITRKLQIGWFGHGWLAIGGSVREPRKHIFKDTVAPSGRVKS
jgi:hypothetical protein